MTRFCSSDCPLIQPNILFFRRLSVHDKPIDAAVNLRSMNSAQAYGSRRAGRRRGSLCFVYNLTSCLEGSWRVGHRLPVLAGMRLTAINVSACQRAQPALGKAPVGPYRYRYLVFLRLA